MSKSNLVNLGLLLLIALLLLIVVYEPGIEEPVEQPPLINLDREAITQLSIQREGQGSIELKKDANGIWWMEKPIRHAADAFRIDSLLRVSSIKSLGHFAADAARLAEFELEQPAVTLTLNDKQTLAFGSSTPLDQRRYVLFHNTVHLISDTLYYHLIGTFPTFLRKQLLADGIDISSLQLPGLDVIWTNNRWQLQPEPDNFSADQVTKLVDNWKLASALQIKSYDGTPGQPVTIGHSAAGSPLALQLTSRNPDLVLARPELGIQYHLSSHSAAGLLQLPSLDAESMEEAEPTHAHGHAH